MASGSQNMTTFKAKGLTSIANAVDTSNFIFLKSTALTADQLGNTVSLSLNATAVTGAAMTNHSLFLNAGVGSGLGTPFQLQIPDSSHLYIYKRWYTSGAWSGWSKISAGHADTWTTARTLTIGDTGKTVDGSANVSWSKDEILGASTNAYFLRGDKTWSNTIVGDFVVNGNLSVGKTGNSNYITFYGITGDNPTQWAQHDYIGNRLYGGTESSELLLFKGNDVGNSNDAFSSGSGPDRIRHIAGAHLFQTYTSALSGTFETVATSSLLENLIYFARNRIYSYKKIELDNANIGVERVGRSVNWVDGRDSAIVKSTSISGYGAVVSIKTTNGSWDIGAYDNSSYTNDLLFSYCTDTDHATATYNNRTTAQIRFYENGHILGTLDGNASTATKLSNTPNNTTTFLRGDNTWTNHLTSTFSADGYILSNSYIQAKKDMYMDAGSFYMKYNDTWYNVLHNHNNGNISINAAGAGLYVAYYNTTFVNWMNGRMQLKDGCLSIFPNNSNYREGIRIHSTGSWSDITLCGNDNTGDSNTSANSWFIGNNNGNFYISRNGSPGGTAYIGCVSNIWKFVTAADIPEGAANLSGAATAHTLSIYRNGITIPYQMNDANDGGMLRVRGTAESNCILELGTWDDSGAGETIQFNYYPTTSQVTPTYSVKVPKRTGSIFLAQPWWTSGNGNNVDNLHGGCTFAYINHNAPTNGMIVAFDCDGSESYTLQLQGNYGGEALYYRNRNGDKGTWNTWRQLVHNAGTWNINVTGSSGSCTGNAATATNADKVDNYHAADLWRKDGGTWNGNANIACTPTANNQEYSFDLGNAYTGTYWHVWSGKNSASILQCYNDTRYVYVPVHLAVGGYDNTSYALSTNSFICNSWIRTKGSTGWYNEDHGGGWYMTDNKWNRSYGSKPVLIDIGTNNTYGIGGHRLALGLSGGGHTSILLKGGDVMYGFCVNNDGNWYFGRRTSKSFESTSGDTYCYYGSNTAILPYTDNAVTCGNSSKRWSAVYGVKVYNAVWNDYAECRHSSELEPGRCVTETSSINGMMRTTERLMPGCKLVSDTYGTLMGETDKAKTPIAVSGRVLAYPYRDKKEYSLGAAVCSAPNGTVDIMTREEIKEYPDRIIGTVSEIPTYEVWSGGAQNGKDDIQVNGRIWIYVR